MAPVKKVDYVVTHKHALGSVRRTKAVAGAVLAAVHPDVTAAELKELKALIAVLDSAENILAKATCPNGMQRVVAIKAADLTKIGKLLA